MANTKKIARMAGTLPKTQRDLLERLTLLGCTITRTGSKHLRVELNGRCVATLGSTPSDHRSLLNYIGNLRRNGVDVRAMKIT